MSFFFFFSSRRRHTRSLCDWSSDVCSSDLDRLAHGADGCFEFVELGFCRHPARIDVQLRHAAVVTLEEGEQVARQVVLVFRGQAADDAAVDRNVLRAPRVDGADEDVARVHVGVEETVAEYLGEEDLHAALGEHFHVGALVGQGGEVGDLHAVDALHHQHFGAAPVPIHLRHVQQLRAFEVALELAGVGGLAQQVEFVVDGFFVIGDHVHRVQQARVGGEALGGARKNEQPRQVLADDRLEAGANHLHHHFFASLELRGVHLCDRGRGQRVDVETAEYVADLLAQLLFDQLHRLLGIKRRHAVLQQHQLIGDVFGQQVAAGGEDLPELDKNRPQILQRQAQARAAAQLQRFAREPAPRQYIAHRQQKPRQGQGEQQVIEAVADYDALDTKQTADGEQLHALSLGSRERLRRSTRASRRSRSILALSSSRKRACASRSPTRVRDSSLRYSARFWLRAANPCWYQRERLRRCPLINWVATGPIQRDSSYSQSSSRSCSTAARSISTALSPSSSTSGPWRMAVLLRLSARCKRLDAGARRVQSASAAHWLASSTPSSLGRINSCKAGLVQSTAMTLPFKCASRARAVLSRRKTRLRPCSTLARRPANSIRV